LPRCSPLPLPGSSLFADQEIGPDAPLDKFDGRRVAQIS